MAFIHNDTRCYHLPCVGIVLQCALQQGKPHFSLIYIMEAMFSVEVEVPSTGVLIKSKLDWT